jgi:two-component system, cell cycle response regulator DivK
VRAFRPDYLFTYRREYRLKLGALGAVASAARSGAWLPLLNGSMTFSAATSTVSSPTGSSSPKTILIVEDNSSNSRLVSDLLTMHGHRTIQTENGLEALALARQHRPDLILMDIQLPYFSGLEVTHWLKSDDQLRSIPVVAVTSFAMPGDEDRIRKGGCDGYVAKPISIASFLRTISGFLVGRPSPVSPG